MGFEFAEAVVLLPFTLAPLLALLWAPLCGLRWRRRLAGLLALYALGLVVLAAAQAGEARSLQVVNPFLDPELGEPRVFVVDQVTAPAWLWAIFAAALVGAPAFGLWVRRDRPPASPHPVWFCGALGIYWLLSRLLLEKSAAPPAVVWATGTTFSLLLMMPFLGYYAAARRLRPGGWLGAILGVALIHRGALVLLGFPLTWLGLGTHLDVSSIERVHLPLGGPVEFHGDPLHAWLRLLLIPQLVIWVPVTLLAGLLLGALFYLRRRRSGSAAGHRGQPVAGAG